MNWNKAVKKIEKALAAGSAVSVTYHRKWMKNDSHINEVEEVISYEYEGQICKALNLYYGGYSDQINEGSHIIDAITIEERLGE